MPAPDAVPDPLTGLIEFLKADTDLAALVSTRVFGAELPRNQVASMPRAAVVVQPAGGGLMGLEFQSWGDIRVDVDCYGSTAFASWQVYLAAYRALKMMQREVVAGVLLHWAKPSARGNTARDPDTDWPITLSSWQVLVSEIAAA